MTREEIENLIQTKEEEIQKIRKEITNLIIQGYQLCDDKQTYEEKVEERVISKRPKQTVSELIGRIYWNEDYYDEDDKTNKITIRRNRIVRKNDIWYG